MTDYRALCIELVDIITARVDPDDCAVGYVAGVLTRARAALADEPAVLDGREPASVISEPSDEEGPSIEDVEELCEEHCFNVEGYESIECLQGLINEAIARWGNPSPQPAAEGEVEGLVKWLRQRWPRMAHISDPDYAIGVRIGDLMEHLSPPQPPAEGEVAELVRLLGSMAAEAELADQVHDASVLDHAAELLQRLSPPQPVPVGERPWEREGWCDKRGMCWWFEADEDCGYGNSWTLLRIRGSATGYTHCLPAHALPVPQGEVE